MCLGALRGEHSLKVARSARAVRAQCKDSPIATWRAEATEKADWEAVIWINEQQRRTQEPGHLDNHHERKRTLKQQWKFCNWLDNMAKALEEITRASTNLLESAEGAMWQQTADSLAQLCSLTTTIGPGP